MPDQNRLSAKARERYALCEACGRLIAKQEAPICPQCSEKAPVTGVWGVMTDEDYQQIKAEAKRPMASVEDLEKIVADDEDTP